MRKNSSKSSHLDKDYVMGTLKEMSEDEFFDSYTRRESKKRNKRKQNARQKLERYREDKELAKWLDDSHLQW